MQSVFGNVGTLICFRLGQADAEIIERELQPVFNRADLVNLPNWHAYVSTLVNGQTVPPFSVETVIDPVPTDPAVAAAARECSRARYGRATHDVDAEIACSLAGPQKGKAAR